MPALKVYPKFVPHAVYQWRVTLDVARQWAKLVRETELWEETEDRYQELLEEIRRLPGYPQAAGEADLVQLVVVPSSKLISLPS